MKRKFFCLMIAFCCLAAAGCNKVEKELPPDSLDSSTSTNLPDSSDSSDTYSSSNDQSTLLPDFSGSSIASDDQSTSSKSSTRQNSTDGDVSSSSVSSSRSSVSEPQSSNTQSSSTSNPVLITSSSSSSTSKPQPSVTQSSKPQPPVTQSSKPQSSVTQSSIHSTDSTQSSYSQGSLSNELIPPENVEIIGSYNQRAPEQWEIEYADEVFRLTNVERVKEGLPEFERLSSLDTAAKIRAWEVLVDYSHTRPDGRKFSTALIEAGVDWQACGENIAAGQRTPEDVVNDWMNSPGHRANILNPNYKYLAVGFYYDYDQVGGTDYRYFWAQNFCA